MKKPQEWFLDASGMAFLDCPNMPNSTYVHVIEKSAYERLKFLENDSTTKWLDVKAKLKIAKRIIRELAESYQSEIGIEFSNGILAEAKAFLQAGAE